MARQSRAVAAALLSALVVCAVAGTVLGDCSDTQCSAGHCVYEDCTDPVNCAGGKCLFSNCDAPSCSGGKCTFYECSNPTCDGGSCDFFHPQTVLKDGFCRGGACHVHGLPIDDNLHNNLAF